MSNRRDDLINRIISFQADETLNFWDKLNETDKLFSVLLSDEGWYIDYDLAIKTLSELYIKQVFNEIKVLDYYMIQHYKKKLPDIELFFQENYKERAHIIKKGIQAHLSGDFELSTPVFLIQTEGIFHDLTEKDIFSKGRGKNKENTAANWFDSKKQTPRDVRLAILESLKYNSNLSANFSESVNFPNALNRNRILHGRDISYNTELNSSKAISLLLFVSTVVNDIESNSSQITWI
ncbi:hypothetical protein [Pedobacter nyackensis]|uniref:Uncharacterized protein n=1 Tax=Pedobacter nyackensis TaxID=475255 RepID=A0A1W2DAP1_9SPHI|nr:hypothetical protein [Pedobacter nyackensis]SMC94443.1 hypothetical protein SAMN04488101_10687 [Pedobacter nyackensis]